MAGTARPSQAARPLTRPAGGRRRWRGASLLTTVLFALPMLLFGGMLSVDLNQVTVTNRQVSSAAEYAAVAGALEFVPGLPLLDPTRAEEAARAAFDRSTARGSHNATVHQVTVEADEHSVDITVTYSTELVTFLPFLENILGDVDGTIERTITRSAFLCDPRDDSDPTLGYCARPR